MATFDVRYSTFNDIGRDQVNLNLNVNNNYTLTPIQSSSSATLSLNDAPIDLLSVHFTGREEELTRIANILDVAHGDVPTRCIIHGMHGLGKSQLALQFAKLSFDTQRYSIVLWVSATTAEKLNHGFNNILNLVSHADRLNPEQNARLTAARRWLEECSTSWLLILDNVDRSTLGFLRQHLPRKNQQGNILSTTRTEDVAFALACAAGQMHDVIELGLPDVFDSSKLLLIESGMDATPVTLEKAKEVVKCVGYLPLAVSHAASFMRQSHKNLDDMLHLYLIQQRMQVSSDSPCDLVNTI
jgi:hypothetical protein